MATGVRQLARLILRRDRIKLPLWIIGIVVSLLAMIPLLEQTYGDSKSLTTLFQTFGLNPAGLFLTGPMDAPTLGALMTIETVLWWGLLIAFMNTFFVVRHTRHNEEIGAQELLLSGQVHRSAALASALLIAFASNALIALGIGVGMSLAGNSWGDGSGWLYGLAFGAFGFVWAVISACVVQLVQSARSANGILAALIGISFITRGIGDFLGTRDAAGIIQPAWTSMLSPFGWMQITRSLTFPQWWPLLIPLIASGILVALSFFLLSRRDVGFGLLPSRIGRSRASSLLKKPFGLTWYLQKNIFIGWVAGVLVMAATIGLLVPGMTTVYESSENLKAMITAMGGQGALIPAFLSAMLSIMVLMIVGYLIHGISRLRSEEATGHLENLLATRLSRVKWGMLHVASVLLGGLIILVFTGALLALCVNITSDFSANILQYVLGAASYWPVLVVFAGIYLFLFGLMPRLASFVTWLYFGVAVFMSWLAPLLKLNETIMSISPLSHLAAAPAQDIKLAPIAIMCLLGSALCFVGFYAWRNRNLVSK